MSYYPTGYFPTGYYPAGYYPGGAAPEEPPGETATGLRTLPGVDLRGLMPLVRGDDYLNADGRAVFFTEAEYSAGEGWPDLTGAVVVLTIRIAGTPSDVTGTVVTATGTKQVRFDIPGSTIALAGTGVFDVQATLSDASIVTLRSGRAIIYADVTQ